MGFDFFNLIVVPATIIFLLVWLVDCIWLKQHKLTKQHNRQIKLAQHQSNDARKRLSAALKVHYGIHEVDRFVLTESAPSHVVSLYDEYQNATQQLIQAQTHKKQLKTFFLVEWAYEWLPLLIFTVVLQGFVVRQFNIPSSSMVPTLYTGDFILVNPAAYGIRLPLVNVKILPTGTPKNGDVVVFRYPLDQSRYYIKRVIGVSGDTVTYDHGVLSINGTQVASTQANYQMNETLLGYLYPTDIMGQKLTADEQQKIGAFEETYALYQHEHLGEHRYISRYLEGATTNQMAQLLKDNAVRYEQDGQVWEIKVPDNNYFVMGDNRDRSEDSRFWGFVHDGHLAGKATYIWMHKQPGLHWPTFERNGRID